MAIKLSPVQRRVLGVLIEKSMTTPGQYPLTMNSLVTGCNQLSCRDPVMSLTEGEVAKAVYDLQQWQLVTQAPPDRTARANRFMHTVEQRFGWGSRERALMAELLLRGPQTVGELKTNASRMTPLEDLHYVSELLGALAGREPPFVRELPRQHGKTVVRYDHLFYPDEEPPAPVAESTGSVPLEARVRKLEQDITELRRQVAELASRRNG
jgi:uncharacterized protein YceH (UPF0502 family)